jgi:hypothetical protein
VSPRHRRIGPTFVDEDQVFRIDARHLPAEGPSRLLNLAGVPLLGMKDLLLASDSQFLQGTADRRETAIDGQTLAQLFEGGIGLLADEFKKPLSVLVIESPKPAAAMGLGSNRSGFTTVPQQTFDESEAGPEPTGDLPKGTLVLIDRGDDSCTKILRIRPHGTPPHGDLPSSRGPNERGGTPRLTPAATGRPAGAL